MDLQRMSEMAVTIGAEHDDYEAAIAEDRDARMKLLAEVVEAVRPALRALGSRLKVREVAEASNENAMVVLHKEHAIGPLSRGLLLSEGPPGPSKMPPRALAGAYSGIEQYLTEAGEFASLAYEGRFSEAGYSWEAKLRVEHPSAIVADGGLERAICAIGSALQRQLGARLDRTREFSRLALRVEALTTLLKTEVR